MVFKNFRIGLIARIVILMILLVLDICAILKTTWIITPTILFLCACGLIINLVRYVDKTNYLVSRFLSSVIHEDFNFKFNTESGNSFGELQKAFALVNSKFIEVSAEKEAQYHYLQNIVENVDTGLITYSESGKILLYNKAAAEILQVPYLSGIEELKNKHHELFDLVFKMDSGEKKVIYLPQGFQPMQLSVNKSVIKIKGDTIAMISLQNISSALAEAETEAWQKLINVLTHEIMNSITPIVSLSSSMAQLTNDHSISEDIKTGLHTIETRGKGLLNFVDNYRTLTRIPQPQKQWINAKTLLTNISTLLGKTFEASQIKFEAIIPDENIELFIDPELIEQVLINLILNAIDAVKGRQDAAIQLIARNDAFGKPFLIVNDNGKGINEDVLGKIFVPFFTTKKNGSGIGLSLSKQIVKLHSGNIAVKSSPGEGSSFVISL